MSDAHAEVQRARRLLWDRQHYEAERILSDYLRDNPSDRIARVERAKLYMTLERNDEMWADIQVVLGSHKPQNAVEWDAYATARALEGYAGPISQANEKWGYAHVAFQESIKSDPKRADVYRNRSQLYIWQENDRACLADLDRALALTPHDIELLARRSYVRKELGDERGALADVNERIRLEPNNPKHYLDRQYLRKENDYAGQIEDLSKALELNPTDVGALKSRALLYAAMGKKDLAIADYERVLELNSDNHKALPLLAYIYQENGNHSKAIELFTRAIDASGGNPSGLHGGRAKSYRAVGNIAAAEVDETQHSLYEAQHAAEKKANAQHGNKTLASETSSQTSAGKFVRHYWLAFLWLSLAVCTLIVMGLLLITMSPSGELNSGILPLMAIGFLCASYRAFTNGFRVIRLKDGWFMSIAATLLSLAIATVIWPFFETARQIRFLLKAKGHWNRGEILTDEGREVHAG